MKKLKEQNKRVTTLFFSHKISLGDTMKVDIINDKIIVFLKKELIQGLDFDNQDSLEIYFKELIQKLKNIYNINISGFYTIDVYIDEIYGAILELMEEDIDYYISSSQVEMRIIPKYVTFLYEINDLFYVKNTKVYKKRSKYYLKVDNNIEYKDYLNILENSKIIYQQTENIIQYGVLINDFNFKKNVL